MTAASCWQVKLPNYARWVDTAKDNAILLYTPTMSGGADLPFSIGCKTDECVVLGRSKLDQEASLVATVEVKKRVVKQSVRQGLVQFICASLKSQLPVISTVTDMKQVGVAFYITGQRTAEGHTIITQRVLSSATAMMRFLGEAIRSIPSDTLLFDSKGLFILPEVLQQPERRRLPIPAPSHTTTMQRLATVQEFLEGPDVANLADVDDV